MKSIENMAKHGKQMKNLPFFPYLGYFFSDFEVFGIKQKNPKISTNTYRIKLN